ncbi:MAG: GrpB family protein [bacterium]|nr:GrpB family protein [bacterium]
MSEPASPKASTPNLQEVLRASRVIRKAKHRIRHDPRETVENKVRRWQALEAPELPAAIRTIGPYDPQWPGLFAREKPRIAQALGPETPSEVRHIGSTSIPGLAGKPIVDLLMAVDPPLRAAETTAALAGLGYAPYGTSPCDPEAHWFWKLEDAHCAFVVHLCERSNPWIRTAVNFRDYMCAHPEDCATYEECKDRLADREDLSLFEYSMEKLILFYEISERAEAWARKRGPGGLLQLNLT